LAGTYPLKRYGGWDGALWKSAKNIMSLFIGPN
jgi:hypothetical protein